MMEIVLIIGAISLFSTAAPASLGNITSFQKDDIYLFIGEMLELNCTLNSSVVGNASDLRFYLRNDVLDESEEKLSDEFQNGADNLVLQLKKRVESEHDAGVYSCFFHCEMDTSSCELVDSKEVAVQWRPQKAEDVTCVVYNWDDGLMCQWDLGVQYLDLLQTDHSEVLVSASITPVSYQYGLQSLGRSIPCPSPLNTTRKGVCVWSDNMSASMYVLQINVTNTQRQKSNETNHLVNTAKIVQPSPVQDLWVAGKTMSCVHTEWNHTRIHRSKLYRVQVFKSGRLLQNVTTTSTSYQHCGLNPFTAYVVSVSCKPERDGYWSDERNIAVTTDEAEPSQSFHIHPGSYIIQQCGSDYTRNATLYFKSVPDDQRNGEIIGYRLEYSEKQVDVNKASPFLAVVENVRCDKDLWVHIYSRTKVGPSNTSSAVLVLKEAAYDLSDFAIELSEDKIFAVWNGSELKQSTDKGKNVVMNLISTEVEGDNLPYTSESPEEMAVFWCVGDTYHKECQEEIKWKTASFKAGRIELPGLGKSAKNYLFGASVGNQPITWTGCLYQKNGVPIDAPGELRVIPSHGELDVQWQSRQCSYSYPYHVKGYTVHICETNNCGGTSRNVFIEGGGTSYASILANLDIQYNLSVRAVMSSGETGPWSESKVAQLQSDDPNSDLPFYLGIPLAALIVLFIAFCCFRLKKSVDSRRAKFQNPLFPDDQYSRHMMHAAYPQGPTLPSPNPRGRTDSAQTPSSTKGYTSVHTDLTYLQLQTISEKHNDVRADTYLMPQLQTSAETCSDADKRARSPDGVLPLRCSHTGFEMKTYVRDLDDEENAVMGEGGYPQQEMPTLGVTMTPCDITNEKVVISNHRPVPNAVGTDYIQASTPPNPLEMSAPGYVPQSCITEIQVTSPSVIGDSGASMVSGPPTAFRAEDKKIHGYQLAAKDSCLVEQGQVYKIGQYIPVMPCMQNSPQDTATSLRSGHAGHEYLVLPIGTRANEGENGAGSVVTFLLNTPSLHEARQAAYEDHVDPYVRHAQTSLSESSHNTQSDSLV